MGFVWDFVHSQPMVASALVAVLTFLFYYLWDRKKKLESTPTNPLYPPLLPGRIPIMGNAVAFSKDPRGYLARNTKEYPNGFVMELVGNKFVMVPGELAEPFFKATDEQLNFDEAIRVILNLDLTLGADILDFPIHTILIKSKFTPNIRLFGPYIAIEVKKLFERKMKSPKTELYVEPLPNGGNSQGIVINDPKTFVMEIMARCSSRSMFGPEVYEDTRLLNSFITFHLDLDDVNLSALLLPRFIAKIKSHLKIKRHYQLFEELLNPVIDKRRAEMKAAKEAGEPYKQVDFLQFMLDATNPDGSLIDNKTIANRMGIMIFAALSTTGGALHNILSFLSAHPECCQKIFEEQKEVMKQMKENPPEYFDEEREKDEDVTYSKAAFEKMKYLDACIRESLRLTSAMLSSTRMAMVDVQLSDKLIIPKGHLATVNINAIHFNDDLYPDHLAYKPERFLNKKSTLSTTSTDFVSFGMGKHACPGRFFAFHEIKTALSHIFRNFELSVKDNKPLEYEYVGPVISMKNNPWILKKRADHLEELNF